MRGCARVREWLFLADLVGRAFPAVDARLARYLRWAEKIPTREAAQARLSLQTKKFHCQGGAAFACFSPRGAALLRAIVALQTISDYLDNLCDREDPPEESRFRRLHTAMQAAVAPARSWPVLGGDGDWQSALEELPDGDWQSAPGDLADGGLLSALVADVRRGLSALPSYGVAEPEVRRLVDGYCHLQVRKHLPPGRREEALQEWYEEWKRGEGAVGPVCEPLAREDLAWHEFAAACGSTLAAFALFRVAARSRLNPGQVRALVRGYFPYICGLHILLDYLIDLEEDRISGDLNFILFYGDLDRARARLVHFARRALEAAGSLPEAWFHRLLVKGLLAMYLSDPKVEAQGLGGIAENLFAAVGPPAVTLGGLCRRLRRHGWVANSWQPPRLVLGTIPVTGSNPRGQ